jgi:hypothetical protein
LVVRAIQSTEAGLRAACAASTALLSTKSRAAQVSIETQGRTVAFAVPAGIALEQALAGMVVML